MSVKRVAAEDDGRGIAPLASEHNGTASHRLCFPSGDSEERHRNSGGRASGLPDSRTSRAPATAEEAASAAYAPLSTPPPPPSDLAPPDADRFYADSLRLLRDSQISFLVAGTFAVNCYTGINRATKDLDIFCKAGDFPRILLHFREHGFETESPWTSAGSRRSSATAASST